MPGVNIAEPVHPRSLSSDERRALQMLVRWDAFWRTDSDLPVVYGLPADRAKLRDLHGDAS
jgi:hypothetical protein